MPGSEYFRIMAGNLANDMETSGYLAYKINSQRYLSEFADQFSKWMAYNELANAAKNQGERELSAEEKDSAEEKAEELAEKFRSSPGFKEVFKSDNPKETIEMLCGNQETWRTKTSPRPIHYNTVQERLLGKLMENDKIRERTKDIVERLDGTLSQSFTGRLKSFFVGNSKEYKEAYEALDGVAKGKSTPEQAKEAVMKYLDLRGKKVRDHQYGRDRFDAMLSGLSTFMEPQEFVGYCNKLNAVRGAIDKDYKGHIDATRYMSDEARQKLKAQQTTLQNQDKQKTGQAKQQPGGPEMQ